MAAAIRAVHRRRKLKELEGNQSGNFEDSHLVRQKTLSNLGTTSRINYLLTQDDQYLNEVKLNEFEIKELENDKRMFMRQEVREFYHSEKTQIFVSVIIMFNFIAEIARSQENPEEGSVTYDIFEAMELAFTSFFALELTVNWYGSWFLRFLFTANAKEHYGWNLFDLTIVVISLLALFLPSLPGITVFRLFRAFRVARLFKRVESLRKILGGIAKSIPGVLQVFSFLVILMGIWSIIGVQLFREQTPQHFSSWSWAMYTMFKALMGDFTGVNDELMYDYEIHMAVIFFASYVFIATVLLMNVVVAVLLDAYLDHMEDSEASDSPTESGSGKSSGRVMDSNKPTLYLKRNGVFQPIRTIEFDQIDRFRQLIHEVSPVTSDEESDTFTQESIEEWKSEKVSRWLNSIEQGVIGKKFKENQIDGKALSYLSIMEMQALGVSWGYQQNLIFNKLQSHLIKQANLKKEERLIRDAFNRYDVDGNGSLDKEEFVDAWTGILPDTKMFSKAFVEAIFDRLDDDNSGELDFDEFFKARKILAETFSGGPQLGAFSIEHITSDVIDSEILE